MALAGPDEPGCCHPSGGGRGWPVPDAARLVDHHRRALTDVCCGGAGLYSERAFTCNRKEQINQALNLLFV